MRFLGWFAYSHNCTNWMLPPSRQQQQLPMHTHTLLASLFYITPATAADHCCCWWWGQHYRWGWRWSCGRCLWWWWKGSGRKKYVDGCRSVHSAIIVKLYVLSSSANGFYWVRNPHYWREQQFAKFFCLIRAWIVGINIHVRDWWSTQYQVADGDLGAPNEELKVVQEI